MTLREGLKQNAELKFDNGVFQQTGLARQNDFERIYLSLRQKEKRFYTDEQVKMLPGVTPDEKLKNEWSTRRISANKLTLYLQKKGTVGKILEVGCGNGWLANKLALDLSTEVLAMDVNEAELLQGARVFSSEKLNFVYGDVFTIDLKQTRFDYIVLASSVQYFRNIQSVIERLLQLLKSGGEIHIIDSPFYRSVKQVLAAKKRSVDHFTGLGHPDMASHYFHHTLKEIGNFNYMVLEDPDSIISTFRRRLFKTPHPVFPWIAIKSD